MDEVTIEFVEERVVNGAPMLVMRLEGVREGVLMMMQGYYYGGDEVTIQMVAYTTGRMWREYNGVRGGREYYVAGT